MFILFMVSLVIIKWAYELTISSKKYLYSLHNDILKDKQLNVKVFLQYIYFYTNGM